MYPITPPPCPRPRHSQCGKRRTGQAQTRLRPANPLRPPAAWQLLAALPPTRRAKNAAPRTRLLGVKQVLRLPPLVHMSTQAAGSQAPPHNNSRPTLICGMVLAPRPRNPAPHLHAWRSQQATCQRSQQAPKGPRAAAAAGCCMLVCQTPGCTPSTHCCPASLNAS